MMREMMRLNSAGSRFQSSGVHAAGHPGLRWALIALFAVVTAAILLASAAAAQELKTYRKKAAFDDVKFDLTNAITNRGLVVDSNGNVGGMLDRTGKDVGSTKQVYRKAEYFVFCSARLSREMMEADAANAGFCPFVVFMYEPAAKPGEVVVGYRPLPAAGNAASKKALAAVNALLDGIAKDAVK
jgi:uncharacterized protein (DUF302 family)